MSANWANVKVYPANYREGWDIYKVFSDGRIFWIGFSTNYDLAIIRAHAWKTKLMRK